MKNEKIVVISPEFFPNTNGLAGHTTRLVEELSKNFEVSLITSANIPYSKNINQTQIFPIVGQWNFLGLIPALRMIHKQKPSRVFIQYLPYLYNAKGGINFSIVFFSLALGFVLRKKIDINFHELYYPFEIKIKSVTLFFSHLFMLFGMGIAADNIFTTTLRFKKILHRIFFFKSSRVFYLPVGSNIPKIAFSTKEISDFRKKYNVGSNHTIGCFSMLHPTTNFNFIFQVIKKITRGKNEKFTILFIGPTKEYLLETVSEARELEKSIICFDNLPDADVSLVFSSMDIFISYFSDGSSTRRGSIMCALAHNIPCIGTKNSLSEPELLSLANTFWIDTNPEIYMEQLESILNNFFTQKNIPANSKSTYDDYFSWNAIVDKYKSAIKN